MAGNKINTKAKGKDEKGKVGKGLSNNEDPDEIDFSVLRKPIHTNITGFAQARKIFDLATEELKDLLSNECDILYECKVCRNIFRSLVNFISHKRVYCKEKFSSSQHAHFTQTQTTANEMVKIWNTEKSYKQSLNDENKNNEMDVDEIDDRIPLTKDLTAVIEKIAKTKSLYHSSIDEEHVTLQKIPNSSVAVYQNLNSTEENEYNNMRAQVNELDTILTSNKAVLQSDGKFKVQHSEKAEGDSTNVIQISDDDDNDDTPILRCEICDLQFSTQKTLRFHMRYKHLESRLVYPCPDCLEIFSTSWSVYRHLFKVHRKSAAQIRRLRESIQAKAFKMNNPPAFYEKKKNTMKAAAAQKLTDEERLDQENQAWMDNMECDSELPRCGGCGRTFERRAALSAHTHTCQPRSRALARRPVENKKIEIQIRKDYNKGPTTMIVQPKSIDQDKPNSDEDQGIKINKDCEKTSEPEQKDEEADMEPNNENVDEPETVDRERDIAEQIESYTQKINLPFAQQVEKNNFLAFKQLIAPAIDISKLLCKKCDNLFEDIQEFYDHMAEHFKWMRYACKLCNYKHYDFKMLPEHVKVVHKLKGDPDFYFTTVKAIDGNAALALIESTEEQNEQTDTSPDSRRPSRCSSDSSRVSDDSSSSSARIESGSRKRKVHPTKIVSKKKKENLSNDGESILKNLEVSPNKEETSVKTFEENSSDLDDIEERISKRQDDYPTVTSRRPVRKRTKPKNEDFEYDLSNLLKMEAQGYRESISVSTPKPAPVKKKPISENQSVYDSINKDCYGAMVLMSKKAVSNASAQYMRTPMNDSYSNQKERNLTTFARPLLPKIISKIEKSPLKKDSESLKLKQGSCTDSETDSVLLKEPNKLITAKKIIIGHIDKTKETKNDQSMNQDSQTNKSNSQEDESPEKVTERKSLSSLTERPGLNVSAVLPVKFRRQSLEVIKNPLINKNISDFSKAGMKTKILVIKPINRNKDGKLSSNNTPLKFQTIKLKDPNKATASNDKNSDQVVVVKVPKVDSTMARQASEAKPSKQADSTINSEDVVAGNKDSKETELTKNLELTEMTNPDLDNINEINDDKNVEMETNKTEKEIILQSL